MGNDWEVCCKAATFQMRSLRLSGISLCRSLNSAMQDWSQSICAIREQQSPIIVLDNLRSLGCSICRQPTELRWY